MTTPVIGVLALQGDVREHLRMVQSSGAQPVSVRRPEEVAAVDALVIPGGESTTMARLARTFEVFEPIRQRIDAGMPTLGTCAGMIMLSDHIEDGVAGQETIGGLDIVCRRNAFGRQVDSFETDVAFADFAEPFHAVLIRAPWVEKVGTDVQVLARVAEGAAAGSIVAVRRGGLVATSFHPEVTGDDRVHRYFADVVRAG